MSTFSFRRFVPFRLTLAVLAAAVWAAYPSTWAAAAPHHPGGYGHGGHGGHVLHPRAHHASPVWYGHTFYPQRFRYGRVYYGSPYRYYGYPRHYLYPRTGIGFSIGNLAPAGDYYYDPYCGLRYASLDLYLDHLDAYDHPWRVQVIGGGGHPIGTYGYVRGGWVGCY